ncbi:TetR/AcrR family transcriptional regulator [Actinomycetospora straminea]|uniref:TetR/AcrR family transcriptional regulator n=1 Tax=Actinomycetospora straminea TaxID=663607 RepID=A0ABP9F2E8_9PSEU|nr:TetR/AcrR family transcriptional regulator [Actinomycetospora straminea]MDD7936099.1 TetR/AcrR family transcriptional regulator [Actinomycetospora straminea]
MSARGSARAKLLDAAAARFYAHGVAGTGIDVITADAGVAKMSLYNNFRSKAELVAAYLERRQQEFLDLHQQRLAALPADAGPGVRVLAVFDAYLEHAEGAADFRGCGLLNAAGELPAGDPGRATVARQKAEVEGLLREALAPREDADALAEHLSLLLEGAMVRGGLDGDPDRLRRARAMAAALVGAE